jgi:transposase
MIRNHCEAVLYGIRTRPTNGFLEATNGLFKAAKRKARGYP